MKQFLIVAASIACLFLSSCAGIVEGDFRDPFTGAIYNESGIQADQKTFTTLFSKITRLIAGEDVSNVILDPFSK